MTRGRIVNIVVWLYLWLSDALAGVTGSSDYWTEKWRQLFRLNHNFDDPLVLLGNAVPLFLLYY